MRNSTCCQFLCAHRLSAPPSFHLRVSPPPPALHEAPGPAGAGPAGRGRARAWRARTPHPAPPPAAEGPQGQLEFTRTPLRTHKAALAKTQASLAIVSSPPPFSRLPPLPLPPPRALRAPPTSKQVSSCRADSMSTVFSLGALVTAARRRPLLSAQARNSVSPGMRVRVLPAGRRRRGGGGSGSAPAAARHERCTIAWHSAAPGDSQSPGCHAPSAPHGRACSRCPLWCPATRLPGPGSAAPLQCTTASATPRSGRGTARPQSRGCGGR